MCCDAKADDDAVAVVSLQDVRHADRLKMCAHLQSGGGVGEVLDAQLFDALATSATQFDHRAAAESTSWERPGWPGPGWLNV